MKHVGPERAELHRQLWAAHCALNTHEHVNARVEELRATLNELAAAVGRENYREAIERARELRALAPPEHADDP